MKSILVKITCIVVIVYGALFLYGQHNAERARKKWGEKKLLLLAKPSISDQDWPQQKQEARLKIVAEPKLVARPEIKTNTSAKTVSTVPLKPSSAKIENVQKQITTVYPKIEKTTQEIAKKTWKQLITKTEETKKALKKIQTKSAPTLMSQIDLKKEFKKAKEIRKQTVLTVSSQPAVRIPVSTNYVIEKDMIYDRAIVEAASELPRGNMNYIVVEYSR